MKLVPYLAWLAVVGQQVLAAPYNAGDESQELLAQGRSQRLTHAGSSMLDIIASFTRSACRTKFGTDPDSFPPFFPQNSPCIPSPSNLSLLWFIQDEKLIQGLPLQKPVQTTSGVAARSTMTMICASNALASLKPFVIAETVGPIWRR